MFFFFEIGGYSFCCWFALSHTSGVQQSKHPRLFSFLNIGKFVAKNKKVYLIFIFHKKTILIKDGAGVECYFQHNKLVMRVLYGSNGQKSEQVCFF